MVSGSIKNAEDVHIRKEIGLNGEEGAVKILEMLGYTGIKRAELPNSLYDIEAITPDGHACIVEVKTRSPEAKTQFFTIRDTKIENLKKAANLKDIEHIYFICINKYGYHLFTIEQLLNESVPSVKTFKYKSQNAISDRKVLPGMRGVYPKLEKTLRIRCSKEVMKDFKSLVIDNDFRNYEDCIAALMRLATANPLLFERFKDKIRWG